VRRRRGRRRRRDRARIRGAGHVMRVVVAVVVVAVVGGCYTPPLEGAACNDEHLCVDGFRCLAGACVTVGVDGACVSTSDCTGGQTCALRICDDDADDCGCTAGWAGRCVDFDDADDGGEGGEGEEGEGGGGEGEGLGGE